MAPLSGAVGQMVSAASMAQEFRASRGDARRTKRVQSIGVAIALAPQQSFPKIFPDEADLQGFYDLIRNDQVEWRAVFEPHKQRTLHRRAGFAEALVVHDTTDVGFRTYWPQQTRGRLLESTSRTHGLQLHTSLAVTCVGPTLPLGVVGVQPLVHKSKLAVGNAATHAYWLDEGALFDNEHERWFQAIEDAEQLCRGIGVRAIHAMDAETDSYGLLSWLNAENYGFVLRVDAARRLEQRQALREIGVLDVVLGERFRLRDGCSNDSQPPRLSRPARLTVRAGSVTLFRRKGPDNASWSPGGYDMQPPSLTLNFVEAVALDRPPGEKAVCWRLLTSEPMDTPEQALRVVELYRRRWVIEEFFKALDRPAAA